MPVVRAEPMPHKPASVRVSLHRHSFYEIHTTAQDGSVGFFRVPLQPVRHDARADQGMMVVNLSSATIGFLHQVCKVGARQNTAFTLDVISKGRNFDELQGNIPLDAASQLCDTVGKLQLPALAGRVHNDIPLPAVVASEIAIPASPVRAASPPPPLDFSDIGIDIGLDIVPCNLEKRIKSERWMLEHLVPAVIVPLLIAPPEPAPPLLSNDDLQRQPVTLQRGDAVINRSPPHVVNLADLHEDQPPTVVVEPDLLCQESIDYALDLDLQPDEDRRHSTCLRAKEPTVRETMAQKAIRLKKRRLGDGSPAADAPPPGATTGLASAAVPAWQVQDLQLLGRACGVDDASMKAMAPSELLSTPRVDNDD